MGEMPIMPSRPISTLGNQYVTFQPDQQETCFPTQCFVMHFFPSHKQNQETSHQNKKNYNHIRETYLQLNKIVLQEIFVLKQQAWTAPQFEVKVWMN
jgi:hypothetical protein